MVYIGAITIGIDECLYGEAVSSVVDTGPTGSGAWN